MHQQQLEVGFTLSSLGMNKTAFGPNNLQTSNITYDLCFSFLRNFLGAITEQVQCSHEAFIQKCFGSEVEDRDTNHSDLNCIPFFC